MLNLDYNCNECVTYCFYLCEDLDMQAQNQHTPPLIFSQKQRFPFNNLQRNLKLSCLSQALCLALVGFSTVAVAQPEVNYERTFGELINTKDSNDSNPLVVLGSKKPCSGQYCQSLKSEGQWKSVNLKDDIDSDFKIAEFDVDYSFEVSKETSFQNLGSGKLHFIFNSDKDFYIKGLNLYSNDHHRDQSKLTFRGGEANRIWRFGYLSAMDPEHDLTVDAPNNHVVVKGSDGVIASERGASININSKTLSISSSINDAMFGSVIFLWADSKVNLHASNLTINTDGDIGKAIFIYQGGGAFYADANKLNITAPIALHASGYQTLANEQASITIKSEDAAINGKVFAVGKAFINLDDQESTYHITGNLEAGRHEHSEVWSRSNQDFWIYEYADAGTINLAGVNSTLTGNAIANYGGTINIELNNGQWTGMGASDTDPIKANIRYDKDWNVEKDPAINTDTEGILNVTLNGSNSVWNVTDNSQVTSITMQDHGVLNLAYAPTTKATAPAYHKVTTKTFSGSNGIVGFRTNLDGGTDQLIITDKATGTHRATIAMSGNADLDHSADWLIQQGGQASSMSFTNPKGKNEFSGRGMVTVWGLGFVPEGDENLLETEEGLKQIAANTTGTGVGNWYLIKQEYFEPDPGQPKPDQPLPDEIVENLSIGTSATQALAYQADLDDLRTRLGEVRYGAQDGAWVKAFTKKEKIGNGSALEQDVNGINVGLDTLVAAQEGSAWLVGGAFRYSNADQEGVALKHVSGELDEYSIKAYATWMHEQGSYADFVLQAGRYKQSLNGLDNTATGSSNAKYRTWGYGGSVEVGHMFSFANDADDSQWTDHWFVEPQLQLAYFHAKGADYHTSTGLKVDQGDADFLMGRAGVAIGKKFNFSDANSLDRRYFQVSAIGGVKHDFIGGDQTIRYTGVDKKTVSVKADELDDTRFYYGVNFDWQLANNWRVYGQVSREEGDQYTKDYDFSLGLKYAF